MTSNGSASVLFACAPPIHGPSPGTAWQPETKDTQAEDNGKRSRGGA